MKRSFDMKNVALFGLSANPPTLGHRVIVSELAESRQFDEIWIIPVYQHIYSSKKNLELYHHRFAMCEKCFNVSSKTNIKVLKTEKELFHKFQQLRVEERVGTIDVLEELQSTHPNNQYYLVLGSDTYNDLMLKKWKKSDR